MSMFGRRLIHFLLRAGRIMKTFRLVLVLLSSNSKFGDWWKKHFFIEVIIVLTLYFVLTSVIKGNVPRFLLSSQALLRGTT